MSRSVIKGIYLHMPVNWQFSTTTASSSGGEVGGAGGEVGGGGEGGLGGGGEGGCPHWVCTPLIRNPL